VVLHDITDDAKLVEVTSTTLGTEGLLKCDLSKKSRSELIITAKSQQLLCLAIPERYQCGDGSMSR
jgi:hypothetical protein